MKIILNRLFVDSKSKTTKHSELRGDDEIVNLLKRNCCENMCMQNVSPRDIKTAEQMLKSKSKSTEQKNWILDFVLQHTSTQDDGTKNVHFVFKGKQVCREAWRLVHGIPKRRLMSIIRDSKSIRTVYIHGNKGKTKLRDKTTDCIAWLKFFVSCIGDQQPDSEKIHLPSCFTKKAIYEKMKAEFTLSGNKVVSLAQWYNIWDKHFKNVLIPKVSS